MPYILDKKNKCIYKKNPDGSRGKRVGCTDKSLLQYLKALQANIKENMKLTENTDDITKMITGYVLNKSEGNLPATAKWNPHWEKWQVTIDGELSGEFRNMKDAMEDMKRSNVQSIKIVDDKRMINYLKQNPVTESLSQMVRRIIKEEITKTEK